MINKLNGISGKALNLNPESSVYTQHTYYTLIPVLTNDVPYSFQIGDKKIHSERPG